MSLQKTEAVVLKTQRLGETSKILTLYSRKFGKLKVVAKGSRGLKSRFFGTLELLNHISIVYYFKETRELQLLSQADIIHPFVGVREDLEKYSLASFFCELIDRTQLEQPNIYLFQVLVESLKEIEKIKENTINVFFWFILKFLHISGFKPHFEACKICRKPGNQNSVRFSLIDGSYTCGNCKNSAPMSITVPVEAINYLHSLQVAPINKTNVLTVVSPESCETLLFSFLQYHIEEAKYLKSMKFLRQIQNSKLI
ncbi:DNA repair protein RecO [candidate division KSB1 bacterium]|nr:DNA repair protein RecO [candidate division KSB1 bacterium]